MANLGKLKSWLPPPVSLNNLLAFSMVNVHTSGCLCLTYLSSLASSWPILSPRSSMRAHDASRSCMMARWLDASLALCASMSTAHTFAPQIWQMTVRLGQTSVMCLCRSAYTPRHVHWTSPSSPTPQPSCRPPCCRCRWVSSSSSPSPSSLRHESLPNSRNDSLADAGAFFSSPPPLFRLLTPPLAPASNLRCCCCSLRDEKSGTATGVGKVLELMVVAVSATYGRTGMGGGGGVLLGQRSDKPPKMR
mmetsp:Transcript_47354/g.118241  ORF Transcript_47354/g.118241 Transcript_47354/m.118241 type:complete len:248 (-) Transcript_47354:305-1048(-)